MTGSGPTDRACRGCDGSIAAAKTTDVPRVFGAAAVERRGAGDQDIGAGGDRGTGGLEIDPAIDLEIDRPARGVDTAAQLGDLGELAGDEFLAAVTGIDGHHQHQVDVVEHLGDGVGGRRRVERNAGFLAQRLDQLNGAVQMWAGFGVNGDDVGAGVDEVVDERIDWRHHKVDIEGESRMRPKRLDHRRADGDVGHEMAVHDVDVKPVRTGFVDGANLLAQSRKISRENRRRDSDRIRHSLFLTGRWFVGKSRSSLDHAAGIRFNPRFCRRYNRVATQGATRRMPGHGRPIGDTETTRRRRGDRHWDAARLDSSTTAARGAGARLVMAIAALALFLTASPPPGAAQSPQRGDFEQPALLTADEVTYDEELDIATARGNVEISQGLRVLR